MGLSDSKAIEDLDDEKSETNIPILNNFMQVDSGQTKLKNCNNQLVPFYTFYFLLYQELHIFESSYSSLHSLHELLTNDIKYQKLFNNKLPIFPSKKWMTNYTQPNNYSQMADGLLNWFKQILSNENILTVTTFTKGIQLPLNADLIQKMDQFECKQCNFMNMVPLLKEQKCHKCNTQIIKIPIFLKMYGYKDEYQHQKFLLETSYSDTITIGYLMEIITQFVNDKNYPKQYELEVNAIFGLKKKNILASKSITQYDADKIEETGMSFFVDIKYWHKIIKMTTCKYIKNDNINDDPIVNAMKCPIYKAMKSKNEFTENNLNHLFEFVHFKDEYNEKPKCKNEQECKSFISLQYSGGDVYDKCHMKMYNHPPRNNEKMINKSVENMNAFIFKSVRGQIHPLFFPFSENNSILDFEYETRFSMKDEVLSDNLHWDIRLENGFLANLIHEVIENGFKYDLCLLCNKKKDEKPCDVKCKHNVKQKNKHTLLWMVEEKYNHWRHLMMDKPIKKRGQMLALLLYTGCDCNYDLCRSQRNGDYMKWKWFDYCLYNAICSLNARESGEFKLYSGLNKVKLEKQLVEYAYMPTYISCSWSRNVAEKFIPDNRGMVIQLGNRNSFCCCDVSWISKFPSECEILLRRTAKTSVMVEDDYHEVSYSLSILDEQNGIQTVSMQRNEVKSDDEIKVDDHEVKNDGILHKIWGKDYYKLKRLIAGGVCPLCDQAGLIGLEADQCYEGDVYCDYCQEKKIGDDIIFHCPYKSQKHPDGFDLCIFCVFELRKYEGQMSWIKEIVFGTKDADEIEKIVKHVLKHKKKTKE